MFSILRLSKAALLAGAVCLLFMLSACSDDKSEETDCDFVESLSGDDGDLPKFLVVKPPKECNIEVDVKGGGKRLMVFKPTFNNNPDQSKVDTDYGFLVREGDPDKILINFMGGGACWHENNCISHVTNIPYHPLMSVPEKQFSQLLLSKIKGILDHNRADNPFADWTMIFVPYTTGDLHWGSNDQEYTGTLYNYGAYAEADADGWLVDSEDKKILVNEDGFVSNSGIPLKAQENYTTVVKHRGFDNFLSVLRYLKKEYPPDTVEQIFVTGQSAGSYGSIFVFPWVKELYKGTRVDILGDGGSGVLPDGWIKENFDQWNIIPNSPDWISGISESNFTSGELTMGTLYKAVAEHYPESIVAQYTSRYDDNQRFFFAVMKHIDDIDKFAAMVNPKNGGASADPFLPDSYSCDWVDRMIKERDVALQATSKNYYYYIGTGDYHTITTESMQDDEGPYATMVADGVKFTDWLKWMVDGSSKLRNVDCAADGGTCDPPITGSLKNVGDPIDPVKLDEELGEDEPNPDYWELTESPLDCSEANVGVKYDWWPK